jgi:outer membrane protein, multidrug efflux system
MSNTFRSSVAAEPIPLGLPADITELGGRRAGARATVVLAALAALLSACSQMRPMPGAALDLPQAWDGAINIQQAVQSADPPQPWWQRTADPAVEVFLKAAEAGHPSLQSVVARIAEARASLAMRTASGRPSLGVAATVARGRGDTGDADAEAVLGRSASLTFSIGWELDLFGRIRATESAAQHRLDARDHDAENTRLALTHDVVAAVVSLRACYLSERSQVRAAQAREATRDVISRRMQVGLAAPLDGQRELGRLALAQVDLASRREECARRVNQLVALTGMEAAQVRAVMQGTQAQGEAAFDPGALDAWPLIVMPLPGTVLLRHPAVLAASSEVEAAWNDIDAARAARWPRISLGAQLSRTWLSAAGGSSAISPWSIGPSLLGTLYDGGATAASISAAEARYQGALADLRSALRQSVQDVEDSLAAIEFANQRAAAARRSLASADAVWRATELRQVAGSVSQLELEDARVQHLGTQMAAVAAARDRALAWAALVKASGNAGIIEKEMK